jgi:signal peptidase I
MGRWVFLITLGALGAWVLRACLFEGIVIASGSMEPTLPIGHHAFVNKMAYRAGAPKRGDIVVFPSPVAAEKDMVKRVIAVEGDVIQLKNKEVLLNGQTLREPYVKHTRPEDVLSGDNMEERVVPRGHVFVLGDNRDESGDSRDWVDAEGKHIYFIPVDKLKGRLIGAQ